MLFLYQYIINYDLLFLRWNLKLIFWDFESFFYYLVVLSYILINFGKKIWIRIKYKFWLNFRWLFSHFIFWIQGLNSFIDILIRNLIILSNTLLILIEFQKFFLRSLQPYPKIISNLIVHLPIESILIVNINLSIIHILLL